MILVSILSVGLFSRLGSVTSTNLQAGRDDLIAALFFAQQLAMSESNVRVLVSANSIDVRRNNVSVSLDSSFYPSVMPSDVQLNSSSAQFSYDKLGRTSAGTIQVQTSDGRYSATVRLEATGYAY